MAYVEKFYPYYSTPADRKRWPYNFIYQLFKNQKKACIMIPGIEARVIDVLHHIPKYERDMLFHRFQRNQSLDMVTRIMHIPDGVHGAERILRNTYDRIMRYRQYYSTLIGVSNTVEEYVKSRYPDIHLYPVAMMDAMDQKAQGCLIRGASNLLPDQGLDHELNMNDLIWLVQNKKLKKVKGIGPMLSESIIGTMMVYGIKEEELKLNE